MYRNTNRVEQRMCKSRHCWVPYMVLAWCFTLSQTTKNPLHCCNGFL